MNKILIAILVLVLASCDDQKKDVKSEKNTYFNDFESSMGWIQFPSVLTTDKAASGKFSTYVNPNSQFSHTFRTSFELLKLPKPKKITTRFKTFVQDLEGLSTLLAIQVKGMRDNAEKDIFYIASELKAKNVTIGSWQDVSIDFTFPGGIDPKDNITVCFWGPKAKLTTYFDDVAIKFE